MPSVNNNDDAGGDDEQENGEIVKFIMENYAPIPDLFDYSTAKEVISSSLQV